MRLKVTDTQTGKVWEEENHPHSWSDLCLFIGKRHKEFNSICYCDIECLAKGSAWDDEGINDMWYMLDECGRYECMPPEFKVEEVKG